MMFLNNSQYNKIQREYDSRRFQNKHDLDKRTQIAYEKIPKLKAIDEQMIENSMNCARLVLNGQDYAIDELKEKNLDLSMERVELLIQHDFPADFLTMHYKCKDCKDTGYINNEKCHCFKQAMVDLVYSQSTIKEVIKHENFSTFRYDYYSNDCIEERTNTTPYMNMKKVVQSCQEFIHKFPSSYQNLLIYGNTGVGKTFLCNCIAKELLDQAYTVVYLTSYQLFELLEKSKFNKSSTPSSGPVDMESYRDYLFSCDLLIIDDLGTEMNNTFTASQLYHCINERHLKERSTIISTNLTIDELYGNYSERIFSRITGNYTLINVFGDDIRYKKHFV